MLVVLAVASLLLVGGLLTAWEMARSARLTPIEARGVALYLTNQGLLAPLIAFGLGVVGRAIHPGRDEWSPVTLAVGFVTFEGVTYGLHRLSHRSRWLWRLHRVHHHTRRGELGWLDGFRQHPIEFLLFQALGNLPAVLVFGPAGGASLWLNMGLRLWTGWLHARGPTGMGPLEWVLTSPRMHHAHHGRTPATTSRQRGAKNYGGLLSVFDWVFGTAARSSLPRPGDRRAGGSVQVNP